jgi:hypothetical protein
MAVELPLAVVEEQRMENPHNDLTLFVAHTIVCGMSGDRNDRNYNSLSVFSALGPFLCGKRCGADAQLR